jgi:hypothetical protein
VLNILGELTPENVHHRDYAKWKAAYIHNCLKNGETPVPGFDYIYEPSVSAEELLDHFLSFNHGQNVVQQFFINHLGTKRCPQFFYPSCMHKLALNNFLTIIFGQNHFTYSLTTICEQI